MRSYLEQMELNRKWFIIEMMTGMGQFTLVSGAFLAGFIDLLGGSDSLNGTMGAIPAVMGFMQIASSLYFERLSKRRIPMLRIVALLRVALSIIYIIPILLIPYGIGLQTFVILYVIGFAMNGLLAPALMEWLVTSTPTPIRGQYFAKRERFGFALSVVLSFSAGRVLDHFDLIGHEANGFLVVGGVVLVLGIVNFFSVFRMDEITQAYVPRRYKFIEAVKIPLSNPGFKRVIGLFVFWNIGLQMGGPFIAIYMVNKLNLTYTYVMTISIIGTIIRIFVAPLWGKLADQKSWYLTAEASLTFLALTHLSWAFVSAQNVHYMAPILFITGGFAWGGVGLSMFNIPFMFATQKGRTMFIGLNSAIGGLISLAAVQLGGRMVEALDGQTIGFMIFKFSSIQLVLFISSLIMLICPLFIRFVLRGYAKHQSEG